MIEKIFESLKSVKPDELSSALEQVQKQIADYVLQEKTQSHQAARAQLYETIKTQIAQTVPDAFSGTDVAKLKYEDMLAQLAQKISSQGSASADKKNTKLEPTETPEQIKARLESMYNKRLEEERTKLMLEKAYSEVEAAAIARKLDSHYKNIFSGAIRSEIVPELLQDKIVYKSKAENKYFTRDGQYASAEQVAEELLKKYPRFVAELPKTPNPTAAPSEIAGNRLRAGIAELSIFR